MNETCRENLGDVDGADGADDFGRGSPEIHRAAKVASTVRATVQSPAQGIHPAPTLPPEAALHATRPATNKRYSRRQI